MSQPKRDGSCLAHPKGTREVEVQWSSTGKGAAGSNSLQLTTEAVRTKNPWRVSSRKGRGGSPELPIFKSRQPSSHKYTPAQPGNTWWGRLQRMPEAALGKPLKCLYPAGMGGKTWERDTGELPRQSKCLRSDATEIRLLGPWRGEVCLAQTRGHAAEQPGLVETR